MARKTIEIQRALTAAGFPTDADGKMGPHTRKQITAFQVSRGLSPAGKVGPLTDAALFPKDVPTRPVELDTGPAVPPPASIIPIASNPKTRWPLQRDCMTFYGGVGLNQTQLKLPYPMKLAWKKSQQVTSISLHKKVAESAGRAFEKIAGHYNPAKRADLGIDLFGGSLAVRKMRGGSSYSIHSWGAAIDFDPERNQLGWKKDKARLAKPDAEFFWRCWEDEGAVSLGRCCNFDFMHIQFARVR